jgi:hypothetical protein
MANSLAKWCTTDLQSLLGKQVPPCVEALKPTKKFAESQFRVTQDKSVEPVQGRESFPRATFLGGPLDFL